MDRGFVGADCSAAITEAALECVSEAVYAAQAAACGAELTEAELQVLPVPQAELLPRCLHTWRVTFCHNMCLSNVSWHQRPGLN